MIFFSICFGVPLYVLKPCFLTYLCLLNIRYASFICSILSIVNGPADKAELSSANPQVLKFDTDLGRFELPT